MKIVIGIPCLNEAKTIVDVIQRLPRKLEGVTSIEVLVVDDGSTDTTASLAKKAGASVVSHGVNKGLGVAFRTMMEFALKKRADIVVTVDGDGQFDLNSIPNLIEPIVQGHADMVTASRFMDDSYIPEGISDIKLWGNRRMAHLISGLTGQRFFDVSCGFRAYSKNCLLNLNLFGKFTYTQETFLDLTYKGFRIAEVPTHVKYFQGRKSRVAGSILRYATNTSKIIFRVYRDYYPLRFFWFLGAIGSLVSLSLGTHFLLHFFETGRFYGALWAGLSGAFIGGVAVLLFILGLVVDMLDRVRMNQERALALMKHEFFYKSAEMNE